MPRTQEVMNAVLAVAQEAAVAQLNAEPETRLRLVPIFMDMKNALDAQGYPVEDPTNYYGAIELQFDGETILAVPLAGELDGDEQAVRDYFATGLNDLEPSEVLEAIERLHALNARPTARPRER